MGPSLARPPGRPAAPPVETAPPTDGETIAREVIDYLIAHPGCVTGDRRRRYTDGDRQLVLDLHERFAALAAPVFADAMRVPEGMLAEWVTAAANSTSATASPPPPPPDASHLRIQTILAPRRIPTPYRAAT